MPLGCGCDWEPEPGMVCWYGPDDYSTLDTKRSRVCENCGHKIEPGALVAKFRRYKVPEHDIEERIYGDGYESGVPRAPQFLCEKCADQWFSLDELGFHCVSPQEVTDCIRDYPALYGPESRSAMRTGGSDERP